MKKRLFSLVLALALCLGLTVTASASNGQTIIASGADHCAVVDIHGDLWMWGNNINGQLGNDTTESSTVPVKVMSDVVSVGLGNQISAAVKSDGTLWVWGCVQSIVGYDTLFWEEGPAKGTFFPSSTHHTVDYVKHPIKLADNVTSVCCGDFSLIAIKSDKTLWVWGDHRYYPDSNGTGKGVKVLDNAASASSDGNVYAAIKTDGSLWMWGSNYYGQLGTGEAWTMTESGDWTPDDMVTPFKLMDDVVSVDCYDRTVSAIKTDGTLWMWGLAVDALMGRNIVHIPSSNHSVTISVLGGTETYKMQTVPVNVYSGVKAKEGNITLLNTSYVMDFIELCRMRPQFAIDQYMTYMVDVSRYVAVKNDGTVWSWGKPVGTSGLKEPVQMTGLLAYPTNSSPNSSSPSNSNSFTDVKSSDFFADAVAWAVEKNITSGTSATTFSPNATCSRAQILTFLWRANGSPEPTTANPFTDIKPTDYYYKAALWAAKKGMVSGSTFDANMDCTRAMTVEYMWKAAGSPASAGKASFTDVPADADYASAVAWAVEQNVTSGTGGGKFSPAATCTRGQIVTFLHRAMGQ